MRAARPRERTIPSGALANFKMAVPAEGQVERHQLFSDSIVSGGANPMGLGGYLWREGDVAVMEVTLGKAFEGAPGRAHGGIVAALIDETMGLVLAINEQLAFTAQLDITYVAPAPINEPIFARAWLKSRMAASSRSRRPSRRARPSSPRPRRSSSRSIPTSS